MHICFVHIPSFFSPSDNPDPPSSFRQVSFTHNSVTLEWIPGFNGGLQQRFRIRWDVKRGYLFKIETLPGKEVHLYLLVDRYHWDQAASFLYMDVFPPRATTFTVAGLQPATTYNFSVNALNAMGESGYADNNAVLTITTKGQFGVTTAWRWKDSTVQTSVYLKSIYHKPIITVSKFLSYLCRDTRTRRSSNRGWLSLTE